MKKKLACIAASILFSGCNADEQKQPDDTEALAKSSLEQPNAANNTSLTQPTEGEKMPVITFRGTVKYLQLEGGFFAIYADDGKKYTPTNLAKEFRIAGLVIEVEGQILTDVLSYQQHGEMLKVLKVKIIDASNAQDR